MKRKFTSLIALMLALVMVFMAGCSSSEDEDKKDKKKDKDNEGSSAVVEPEIVDDFALLDGEDIYDGARFDEMIWGYYEAVGYEYDGSFEDSAQFRDGMKYVEIDIFTNPQELGVLPLSLHAGDYSHFMGSFTYDGHYYEPYTELGRAMYRKAYVEQFGDMTEEEFQRIEAIMDMNAVEVTLVHENGATSTALLVYEIQGNKIDLYSASVNDDYTVTMSEEPVLSWSFLHDGGTLKLACDGVVREYKADGMKDTDNDIYISGYAINSENRYEDLVGFYMNPGDADNTYDVGVELIDGTSCSDAVLTLDKDTGAFTLTWQEVWGVINGQYGSRADNRTITGTMILCPSYGFTDYEGFMLKIDGKVYKYLMTSDEYDERMQANMAAENEALVTTRYNMLKELEEAFKAAGLNVVVDYDSGKVSLDNNFLFATDSYELSAEGQDYLNRFVGVYTSVVLREEYAAFVSGVLVEGHTDTSGSYAYNLTLSQNRADAVAQQCIAQDARMADIIQAYGCSYDYPVYDANGAVDMAASRRVTFRFMLAG